MVGSQGRPSANMTRVSKKCLPCLAAVDSYSTVSYRIQAGEASRTSRVSSGAFHQAEGVPRARHYPSDTTDAQWAVIDPPLLDPAWPGRKGRAPGGPLPTRDRGRDLLGPRCTTTSPGGRRRGWSSRLP